MIFVTLFAAIISSCLILEGAALKCYQCSWMDGPGNSPEAAKECMLETPEILLENCTAATALDTFKDLTVKTESPICVKAYFHVGNGTVGVARYCGYPLAKANASCVESLEATATKPENDTQLKLDPTQPAIFTYCSGKDGCNDGEIPKKCDPAAAADGTETKAESKPNDAPAPAPQPQPSSTEPTSTTAAAAPSVEPSSTQRLPVPSTTAGPPPKCYNCFWLATYKTNHCRYENETSAELIDECTTATANPLFRNLTILNEPPVCIKTHFTLTNGTWGLARYCGYPFQKDVTCIKSKEASSHPDVQTKDTLFDKEKPVTFFYCKDKDGCNGGAVDGPCDNSNGAGLKATSSMMLATMLLLVLGLAKTYV